MKTLEQQLQEIRGELDRLDARFTQVDNFARTLAKAIHSSIDRQNDLDEICQLLHEASTHAAAVMNKTHVRLNTIETQQARLNRLASQN